MQEKIESAFTIRGNPTSLALTIYEADTLKSSHSIEGIDFSNHYVVQHCLSGPRRLRRMLAHSQVQARLEEPFKTLNSSFLYKETFDEALTKHLDTVFSTPQQQGSSERSEFRSRSRIPNPGRPRSPTQPPSMRSQQSNRAGSRTADINRARNTGQTSSSSEYWENESWSQNRWQPKDWSCHSWEGK